MKLKRPIDELVDAEFMVEIVIPREVLRKAEGFERRKISLDGFDAVVCNINSRVLILFLLLCGILALNSMFCVCTVNS